MGLAGWNSDNKLKLTIDASKIDSTLLQGNSVDKTQCTASSQYSSSYIPDEAWDGIADGSTANSWLNNGGTNPHNPDGSCYIQWNFGVGREITWMRFHTRGNGGNDAWPSNIKILGSNTGSFSGEETTLYDDDVPGASGMSPDEWSVWMQFTAHGYYQYLRMEIHERYVYQAGGTWFAIQEVEFMYELSNFPVLISLSSSSGQTSYDTTGVFDELATISGSYDNRKKIAVTTTVSGVETELFVEIERWDDTTASGNEQAWLWTKVPTVSSGTDTELYLYYDSNHTTNSGYIGDTGETPAQNVWDSNFNAVFHFSEDSYTGAASEIKNSTISGIHGHAISSAQPSSALIGNGLDVDDVNKGAITESTINPGNVYTAESFFLKPWSSAGVNAMFKSTSPNQYMILIDTDNLLAVYDGAWRKSSYDLNTISNGWHHLVAVSDDTNTYFYVDGGYVDSVAYHCTGGFDNFGGTATQSWGDIDEARVSDVQRSAAWIKATYYSNFDDLITFSPTISYIHYFSGTVYELGSTVSGAQIFMYKRDTGEYLGSTTSSGDGGFYITTSYSGSHFLACLDPEGGQSYNDLIYGEMYPITITISG